MNRIICPCLIAINYALLGGCAPEASTAVVNNQRDELMDISTWDFGEIDPDDQKNKNTYTNDSSNQYAIAVATFTGTEHKLIAKSTLSSLIAQYPTIGRKLTMRDRSRGSVLTYGVYSGYDDPSAKKDILMLRSIPTAEGKPLFGQVLLTKFKSPRSRNQLHPYDLWTARREFPTIVPIFTLEVAVWGDFESGEFPRDARRLVAEQYAAELRQKGFEAFFYHNDDRELSSVTVGLFGHNAVDAQTGFYSADVEAILSRFPERLINGQPIMEYRDPSDHSLGTRVQPPSLAEIPID
ncbi:MAG: hypothetical protein QF718_02495 [Phycisphaerales bacterium]|jgi:hypothetical protein|nr:hypothetical protein [Phycisphaerales bacterium]